MVEEEREEFEFNQEFSNRGHFNILFIFDTSLRSPDEVVLNGSDAFSTLLQKTFGLKKKFHEFKVKADKAKSLFQLLKSKGDPIMFLDVHLPKSMSIGERIDNILQNQISTNIEIVAYVLEGEIEQSLYIDLDDVLPGALEGLASTLDTPSLYGMPKPSKGKECLDPLKLGKFIRQ